MASNQVVAVWGSPGSGTTLTSVKIARELANRKKNVVLVLSDNETPMAPLLAPSMGDAKSLGDLMKLPTVSQIDIFQHCISIGKTISLLGYLLGENELTYPEYDEAKACSFLDLLRNTADHVIIDCSHHLLTNTLTGVALQNANVVFRVVNADPKSLSYIKSQRPILSDPKFQLDQHVCIINNVSLSQDAESYKDAFGGRSSYILPHLSALQTQFTEARLLEAVPGREGRIYETRIHDIVKAELLDEQRQDGNKLPYALRGNRDEAESY